MDTGLALPGHGELIDDLKGLLQEMFHRRQEGMNLIFSILSQGDQTPCEIAMVFFPRIPPFEVFLGTSEVLGHTVRA